MSTFSLDNFIKVKPGNFLEYIIEIENSTPRTYANFELTNLYVILDNQDIHLEESTNKLIKNNVEKIVENTVENIPENNNIELSTNLEDELNELTIPVNNLENSDININNKQFYEVYELIDNKIKENIIHNLRNIFIHKKIKNNIDLFEMMEDEEEN